MVPIIKHVLMHPAEGHRLATADPAIAAADAAATVAIDSTNTATISSPGATHATAIPSGMLHVLGELVFLRCIMRLIVPMCVVCAASCAVGTHARQC